MAENWIEPMGKYENVVCEFTATPENIRIAQEVRIALQAEYDIVFLLRTTKRDNASIGITVTNKSLHMSSSNLNNMKGFASGYARHMAATRSALRALIGE